MTKDPCYDMWSDEGIQIMPTTTCYMYFTLPRLFPEHDILTGGNCVFVHGYCVSLCTYVLFACVQVWVYLCLHIVFVHMCV